VALKKLDTDSPSSGGRRRKLKVVKEKKPPVRFTEAPDVARIANELIQKEGLTGMWALRQARILYLFSSADRIAGEDVGHAGRYPKKFTYAPKLEFDFVITISRPQWEKLADDLKPAAVYHYLLHCGSDINGRWHVEPHDFEGFYAEGMNFKPWNDKLVKAKQLGLFDQVGAVRAPSTNGHRRGGETNGTREAAHPGNGTKKT